MHTLCVVALPSLPTGSGTVCAGGLGFGHRSYPAAGHTPVPAAAARSQKYSEKTGRPTGRNREEYGEGGPRGKCSLLPCGSMRLGRWHGLSLGLELLMLPAALRTRTVTSFWPPLMLPPRRIPGALMRRRPGSQGMMRKLRSVGAALPCWGGGACQPQLLSHGLLSASYRAVCPL